MRTLPFIAGLALLAACSGGELGVVVPAESAMLATPSTALAALPDGHVVAELDGALVQIDPRHLDVEPIVIGPASEVGEVHAAVPIRGAVLVLASGGTFVVRDSAWVPSPLASALDGPIEHAVMLQTPTGRGVGDLWIATRSSLYRVRDDVMERLELDQDLTGARLAAVRRADGPALWVLLSDRLLEVWQDRSGTVRTARLVLPTQPSDITGDAAGEGWLVVEGRLHSVGADRRLVDRGLDATRVLGSPWTDEVWAFASDGSAVLHADGGFFAAEGASIAGTDRVALGPDGSLYVASATVRRLAPRRDVTIDGAADGTLLVTPETFSITLQGTPAVEASVDGQPLTVLDDPLRVELTPAELGDGEHELFIRVAYDDGTLPVEERRTFQIVTSATWTDDVSPIYEAQCASCHGPEGPAITRLDSIDGWRGRSDQILVNVEEGRMPLNRPPLSQREIALIQAWIASGFPE